MRPIDCHHEGHEEHEENRFKKLRFKTFVSFVIFVVEIFLKKEREIDPLLFAPLA
jgi:hypothetical protein